MAARTDKLSSLESKVLELSDRLNSVVEENTSCKIENDSLRNEIRGLKDSNLRLSEMLAESKEYKAVARMAKPAVGEKKKDSDHLRYLKGSGAIGKKDLVMARDAN